MKLTPATLRAAYRNGWFPMGDPRTGTVRWYRPARRAILPLGAFHCPRRLARTVRSGRFEVTFDRAFAAVVDGCADRRETWITPEIREAYLLLHEDLGARSVEAWRGGALAGGLYGVTLGAAFMAESMFHRQTDASKVCLAALVEDLARRGFRLLDVQYLTRHLASFGAVEIPHGEYMRRLAEAVEITPSGGDPTTIGTGPSRDRGTASPAPRRRRRPRRT